MNKKEFYIILIRLINKSISDIETFPSDFERYPVDFFPKDSDTWSSTFFIYWG